MKQKTRTKTLISWYAKMNDFLRETKGQETRDLNRVNEKGPSFNVHRYFGYDYKKHVILCTLDDKNKSEHFDWLVDGLKKEFTNTEIEPRIIKINDVIDVEEIFEGVSMLLRDYKNEDVEVFVNPGTPQMQIAWHLVAPNFKNIKLFQIREARHTENKQKPERIYTSIDRLLNATTISIANENVSRETIDNTPFLPSSLEPVYKKARQVAKAEGDYGCLITGENGTGKEHLAHFIYQKSNRSTERYFAVNCAAYSDELLQSELFGHEKDSFTGANTKKLGVFESADGGIVFLDEIGDISPRMQVSLLRVLQEKKYRRLGGTQELTANVRIIAATNKNLEEMCEKEEFRWDLYFRLAVATLELPPLRDWTREDRFGLINHFNKYYLREFPNRNKVLKFKNEVMKHLLSYHFTGNVRELQNLIISLYMFSESEVSLSDLPDRIKRAPKNRLTSLEEVIKQHIIETYGKNGRNLSITARKLGKSRDTIRGKLQAYGVK